MPDTTLEAGLLWELRDKIKDTAWTHPQFSLRVSGSGVTSAILEIEENALSVTITGGSTPDVDLSFSSAAYDTVEKIVNYLNTLSGYEAEFNDSGDPRHPSTDLQIQAPISVLGTTYQVRSRRWSDGELTRLLTDALRRHNVSVPRLTQLNYSGDYTLETIPEVHKYFIVLLAQIEVLKTLIQDSSKRRGTDMSVAEYDTLKRSLEDEYQSSLDRLVKSVEAIPPVALTEIDNGDVVIGHSYRTRPYTRWPFRGPITPSVLAPTPRPSDISAIPQGDGVVLLEWERNRNTNFDRYEIWRGDTDEVSNRSREITPVNALTFDGVLIATFYQQWKQSFIDGLGTALTPGLYYYRLYTYNRNGDFAASQAISVEVE